MTLFLLNILAFFVAFICLIAVFLLKKKNIQKKKKGNITAAFDLIRLFAREKRIQKGGNFKWREFWGGIKNIVYQYKVNDFADIQLPNTRKVSWILWVPNTIRRPLIYIFGYLEERYPSVLVFSLAHFIKKILEIPVELDISKMRNQNEIFIAIFQMALNIGQLEGFFGIKFLIVDIQFIVKNYENLDNLKSTKEILERIKLYLSMSNK
jgi:hypothetical protein